MARGRTPRKEAIIPDTKYNSVIIAQLVNFIMEDGKKSVAEKIVYGAFDILNESTKEDPSQIFTEALENIMPSLEVKSRRVGGATYQVPMEVSSKRRLILALRWLVSFSKKRSEKTMRERLAKEILDAKNNRGTTVKKREETHKMAEANKAFSHFRW